MPSGSAAAVLESLYSGSGTDIAGALCRYTRLTYMHDAPPSAGALDKNCTLNFNLFYNKALVRSATLLSTYYRSIGDSTCCNCENTPITSPFSPDNSLYYNTASTFRATKTLVNLQVGEHKEKAVTDKQLSFSEIRCGRTSTQQRRNGETVTVYNEDSDVRCELSLDRWSLLSTPSLDT